MERGKEMGESKREGKKKNNEKQCLRKYKKGFGARIFRK